MANNTRESGVGLRSRPRIAEQVPGPSGPLSAKNDPLDHFSGAPSPKKPGDGRWSLLQSGGSWLFHCPRRRLAIAEAKLAEAVGKRIQACSPAKSLCTAFFRKLRSSTNLLLKLGMHEGAAAPSFFNPQAAACTSPRRKILERRLPPRKNFSFRSNFLAVRC